MRANLDNELEYPIDEETFESLTEKVLEQAILMRAAFQVDEDNEAAIARVSRASGQYTGKPMMLWSRSVFVGCNMSG